jgi:hypothetical protein
MDKLKKGIVLLTSLLFLSAGALLFYGLEQYAFPSYPKSYETLDKMPDYSLSENKKQLPALAHPSVIRLHSKGKKDKKDEFFCSAFVISDVYAVTAGHCLEDGGKMSTKDIVIYETIRTGDTTFEHKSTGVVVRAAGINRRGDTGLITGDFSTFKKLKFSPYPSDVLQIIKQNLQLAQGQMVSVGFPYGDIPLSVPVKIEGTDNFHLAARGLLYPGMSGGVVIDPITEYVVGINSYVNNDIIAFSSVIGLLESLNVKVVP